MVFCFTYAASSLHVLCACCRFVSELQSWWREQQEHQPVLFMETQALPALKVSHTSSQMTLPVRTPGTPQSAQHIRTLLVLLLCILALMRLSSPAHGSDSS